MRNKLYIAAIVLAAICFPVAAQREALEVSKIFAQQQQIREGVKSGAGLYKEMPVNTRNELLAKQESLLGMLEGKRTTDELSEQQKVEAFNTLEWIEAAVNRAEDERMVCELRPKIGSNRKERICKTMAQIKREREAARQTLESREIRSN